MGSSIKRAGLTDPPRIRMSGREFFIQFGALAVLLGLILFNIIFTPNFASINTLYLVIKQSAGPLCMAIGMTLVISIGGIDISTGSIMALCGVIIAQGMTTTGGNFLLWLFVAVGVCALVGMFNGVMIAKYNVQPVILTLVMQIVIRGVAVLIAKSSVFSLGKYPVISALGLYRINGVVPIQSIFFVVVAVVSIFAIKKTTFGTYVESIGENTRAARLSGLHTVKIIVITYALSSVLASLCGVIELARSSAVDPNELGMMYDLDAIAAVAIGGTSMKGGMANVVGSIAGAIIMVLIGITVNMNNIPFAAANLIKAVIIIGALAIQRERTA
ncbi:ABC transporter permease [Oscillospiraceae bacterium MB08-C2-2]|nr:ABC transporter permease [Oscillospiraceae bacterium MB08-C2-2]